MPRKSSKQELPYGSITAEYWDKKPEKLSAFYTAMSQRYFMEMINQYIPECSFLFEVLAHQLEKESTKHNTGTWKDLAHEWANLINSLTFYDNKKMRYHREAVQLIMHCEPCHFPIMHRSLMISANMMDHMDFHSALELWKELRKEEPENNKTFEVGEYELDWVTPTKLVDHGSGKQICIMDDKPWLKMSSAITSMPSNPLKMQPIALKNNDKPN